ncbi:phenylalanine--tRNA ligase subunit beta [Janibacter sp. Soil728]|uniref:phenylalanine--tRNA ligase subunit beta n=1 Tax=Janibacter sp. Soil728 TaxID=1736393 RepID=UPI0006F8C2D8|nr:phenylalanine--tRNA ligase subunit beta [Janibacter sp. Soil728]KRE38034.1 phenylalanine--tRNA ligase subunit beta [Janibacter sp. Soil728]
MRAPIEWLRELTEVVPEAKGADVAASLVRVGLEEEDIFGGESTGPLVVGKVLERTPEEQKNGKTINWCRVDVGTSLNAVNGSAAEGVGIVCGAHNFDVGDLVAVILPGGVLPGNFEIAARKTYGHVSAGMICSAMELGLGEDHDGIIVLTEYFADRSETLTGLTPGDDLIPVFGLDAETVEVNVTPDRGYCFSMRGIAREYALSEGTAFVDPADLVVAEATGSGYEVRLADDAPVDGVPGCDRYVARIVRGIDATAPSPEWMQRRLTEVGMRPISLAVDVTNYVMMLLGQPLHAFDLDTLSGAIEVRRARAGETLKTLDDVERTLDPTDLLITDGGTTPLAIAGVMGGETSEVTASTVDVLVEAAHFDPVSVARSARRHRLATEASKRFERGVDPAVTAAAAQLAVDLLVEHGGGTADPSATDVGTPAAPSTITFDPQLPTRYIGLEYPRDEVVASLTAIGCAVSDEGESLRVTPPTWRPDLTNGPDLVEEVARVRGYDQIPSVVPRASAGRGLTHEQRARRVVARTLAATGLVEVLSYPFTSSQRHDDLGHAADDVRRESVRLANPLQDEAPLMRTSILDTLLDTLRRNVSRGQRDVGLYEIGLVTAGGITPLPLPPGGVEPDAETLTRILDGVPAQPRHVAIAATGAALPAGPHGAARAADPTDVVGWARALGAAIGVELSVEAAQRTPFHPGRCVAVSLPDGTVVGHAGELHPKVCARLELPERTVAAELDLDAIVAASGEPVRPAQLSTQPVANTDVALVVDEGVPAAAVAAALRSGAGKDLESLTLFDVYRGDQVGEGRKSLAYRLTFRANRTLKTDEVSKLRDTAVAAATSATGAQQR